MAKSGQRKGNGTIRVVVAVCILAVMLVGFYYYLTHKSNAGSEDDTKITKSQQVLMRNLESNYPPSPKEVMKYYCDITQCFYNEEHTEAEIEELGRQIQKLYDIELVENQTEEVYLENLKVDILSMSENVISSYSLPSSTDVDYFSKDGYDWARLYCNFNIRKGTDIISTVEQFLLRKDENGRWKIYGWKLVEE